MKATDCGRNVILCYSPFGLEFGITVSILLFSSLLDSEDKSDIEDDPSFPFPSPSSDDEALLSDTSSSDDDQSPTQRTPDHLSTPSSIVTTSNTTTHKL